MFKSNYVMEYNFQRQNNCIQECATVEICVLICTSFASPSRRFLYKYWCSITDPEVRKKLIMVLCVESEGHETRVMKGQKGIGLRLLYRRRIGKNKIR